MVHIHANVNEECALYGLCGIRFAQEILAESIESWLLSTAPV
jgi:hypothetical protein